MTFSEKSKTKRAKCHSTEALSQALEKADLKRSITLTNTNTKVSGHNPVRTTPFYRFFFVQCVTVKCVIYSSTDILQQTNQFLSDSDDNNTDQTNSRLLTLTDGKQVQIRGKTH